MASITTITVGLDAQPLAPAPVVGAAATVITVINLDTVNVVNLGSSSSQLGLALGPLASITLAAPVWAGAATGQLQVGIIPGGSNYSPGALTITGPVTATITGTVDADVTGTVAISSGTVDATVTGTVDIAAGSVTFTNDTINVVGDGGTFPPGAYSAILSDTTVHTIAAGAGNTYITPVLNVQPYQSFSMSATAYCTAQNNPQAPLVAAVQISWYADSGGTVLLETDMHWMWLADSSAGASLIPFSGGSSARGAYMTITFYQPGLSTEPIDVTSIRVYGSGRVVNAARFNQSSLLSGMNSGLTFMPTVNPTYNASVVNWGWDGILVDETYNNIIAPNATVWFPLPLFEGQVSCRFSTANVMANDFVLCTAAGLINGYASPGTSSQGALWNPGNTAGAEYTANLNLANAPTYIVIKATSSTPIFSLQIQGAPS